MVVLASAAHVSDKPVLSVMVLKRNRTNSVYSHIQLWTLMGLKICSQQAGNPGESVFSSSLSPKAWSARELMVQSQSKGWMAWDPGRIHVSVEAWKQEEKKKSSQPACSQTEEFFLHWGYSFFPSVLVLFGWSLDTLGRAVCFTGSVNLNVKLLQKHPCSNAQNNVWLNIWVPRGLVELAREVNSYSHILRFRVDMNFGRHYYAI